MAPLTLPVTATPPTWVMPALDKAWKLEEGTPKGAVAPRELWPPRPTAAGAPPRPSVGAVVAVVVPKPRAGAAAVDAADPRPKDGAAAVEAPNPNDGAAAVDAPKGAASPVI